MNTGTYLIEVEDEGCLYDTTFTITDVRDCTLINFDFCPDDEYFLSSTSVLNGSHQWTNPDGTVIGNNANIKISDIIRGEYIDSCEVNPGCFSITTYFMDTISLNTDHDKIDIQCAGSK